MTTLTAHSSEQALPESAFLNRELSWLAFNERVLFEAQQERNPLLERLKFASIAGSNLDEFFMVRVAGIHRQIAAGVVAKSPDGLTPGETIMAVRKRTRQMLRNTERALNAVVEQLRDAGVKLAKVSDLEAPARHKLRELYLSQIEPVLTPLAVDPSHPFPYLSNLSLNLAVTLADDGELEFARVKVPVGVLSRFVELDGQYLLLEEVIAAHLDHLFRGRTVQSSFVFRVTRNTDYEFEEEEAEDLLQTIEEGLRRRRFGAAVRLEITRDMPADVRELLRDRLNISDEDVFEMNGPLGVADFMTWRLSRPDLSFAPFTPHVPDLEGDADLFSRLRGADVLLHHPYDSFEGVLRFLEAAASDPDVLAIKQTLYRTGGDERLFNVLEKAAERGKQVVALIELKARFDEQRNIAWARALERAGAHVVYGMTGLKTHAKVTLVVRRESGGLKRYAHVGTGNYNPRTARLYTDFSLLTSDTDIGEDVSSLFNHLTGYAEAQYHTLLVAPDTAREQLEALIDEEGVRAGRGEAAWIHAKMNQLTDPGMIAAFYRASQAGVKIKLMVRGVCCLRPGVPGLSENITVRSLLGRFLEHARLYAFSGSGVYFGSADLMSRNLNRRVEVIAPACREEHRDRLLERFEIEWRDERGSWQLDEDGTYHKFSGDFSAQQAFMTGQLPPLEP
ncbi:polyphosphate kinase 1 [Deinococcus peraridilitoris]|uniref:Polyphosphate kinase n=1 Tax=Deinococcus peraridilitoris (strain DSM 19664 / LMG 22246 / CIP 109416 / KR-200) TaxID=937777 RepID=L0A0Z0_DEIPD|nr:polyphosphate kinase 1 [Deinococcus peraridilitoris]AFZ66660.1 polyphosphate kinase 1 [Deinococcus peraridilitoris DSM 19664]